MASKIFAGGVVTFWLAMMIALVRVEFFPKPMPMNSVPAEQVMRRIFESPEQRLDVFYQGQDIGNCRVEVTPVLLKAASTNDSPTAPHVRKVYQMHSSVHITLSVFGIPSHLRLTGQTQFNARYEVEEFSIRTMLGDGHIDLQGDDRSHKVKMVVDMGEVREKREFSFDQLKGAGLANALGLPGLSNLGFLGGGGFARPSMSAIMPATQPQTTAALTQFKLGDTMQEVYLIESRLDERVWAKMWVDRSGGILRVETSLGLEMLSDTANVTQKTAAAPRKIKPAPRQEIPPHDPH